MAFQIEASLLMRELFWKGLSFGQRIVHVISIQRKDYGSKVLFTPFLSARKGLWLKGLFIPFLSIRKGYGSKSCSHHFYQQDRGYGSKVSSRHVQFFFSQRAPRHQSMMILKYHSLGTCVFGYWKGVGRLEAVVSLNAYQITKYQVL